MEDYGIIHIFFLLNFPLFGGLSMVPVFGTHILRMKSHHLEDENPSYQTGIFQLFWGLPSSPHLAPKFSLKCFLLLRISFILVRWTPLIIQLFKVLSELLNIFRVYIFYSLHCMYTVYF